MSPRKADYQVHAINNKNEAFSERRNGDGIQLSSRTSVYLVEGSGFHPRTENKQKKKNQGVKLGWSEKIYTGDELNRLNNSEAT